MKACNFEKMISTQVDLGQAPSFALDSAFKNASEIRSLCAVGNPTVLANKTAAAVSLISPNTVCYACRTADFV